MVESTSKPLPNLPGSIAETDLHYKPQPGPPDLERASRRLEFPPSYVVVGIYRFATDRKLWEPAWDKCRHGTRRGLIAGFVWTCLSFKIQKKFIQIFLSNSPRVTGLSDETIFGYKPPFSLITYAAVLTLSSQVSFILSFFLYKNIRIARDRAYAQTVASRGKGPEFWIPYVEEWEVPPQVDPNQGWWGRIFESSIGRLVLKRVILFPVSLYPFVGMFVSAWFKALGTARYLHKPYFEAKKMNKRQVAVFMEERKWDYRAFGMAAALFETLPIVGLIFTISNRIGAAMWAHDLEKRQHAVAAGLVPKVPPQRRLPPAQGQGEYPAQPDGPPPPYETIGSFKTE